MESVISEGSPLATYLEGRGESDTLGESRICPIASDPPHFAPQGYPKPKPGAFKYLSIPITPSNLPAKIRRNYADVVSYTLSGADNERFLEHFRYIIIASQLLNDHVGPSSSLATPIGGNTLSSSFAGISVSTNGAIVVASLSFAFALLVHWARGGSKAEFHIERLSILLSVTAIIALVSYAYATRKWMQFLRRQAIDAASALVVTAQALESSSSSVFTMIQEVELVARGYSISNPLPPISRLESGTSNRRCQRLRRSLHGYYAAILPAFLNAVADLRPLVDDIILERFLDVYDVRNEDLREAGFGYTENAEEDPEGLKSLRLCQARYATLRRLLLCCLLSLDANGRSLNATRWRVAISQMELLATESKSQSEKLIMLLGDEERISSPTSPKPASPLAPKTPNSQNRLQNQLRRISTLSNGIRSLQAKLYLLKEDSAQALANPSSEAELSQISASLRDQYETLGTDLQALMQAWESGKQALTKDITRQTRRMSRSSSLGADALLPRIECSGHLESVDEHDTPIDGARDAPSRMSLPLSPPVTEDGSDDNSIADEVFEAVASPKVRERSTLTRDQRVAKMQEDRIVQAELREKRETDVHMMQELQSVMKQRPVPARRTPTGRITSM